MKTEEGAVVCGGQEHEEPELIHPCPCDGGSTLAVGNTGLWGCSKQSSAVDACLLCAARGSQAGKGKSAPKGGPKKFAEDAHNRSTRRHVKSDQSCKGVKRLRSALTNGGVASKGEAGDHTQQARMDKQDRDVNMDDKGLRPVTSSVADPSKADVPLLGRRFSDVPTSVPIKKRRLLNMAAVARSPSPPPPTPPRPAQPESIPDIKPEVISQDVEDADMAEGGLPEEDGRHASAAAAADKDQVDRSEGLASSKVLGAAEGASQGKEDVVAYERLREDADSRREILQEVANVGADAGVVDMETAHLPVAPPESAVEEGSKPEHVVEGMIHSKLPVESVAEVVKEEEDQGPSPNMPELLADSPAQREAALTAEVKCESNCEESPALAVTKPPGVEKAQSCVSGPSAEADVSHGGRSPVAGDGTEQGRKRPVEMPKSASRRLEVGGSSHVDAEGSQAVDEKGRVGSFERSSSRDVRFHWDLNMDMAEWERPTEDGEGVVNAARQSEADFGNGYHRQKLPGRAEAKPKPETERDHNVRSEVSGLAERESSADAQRVDIAESIEFDEHEFDEEDDPVLDGDKVVGAKGPERGADKSLAAAEVPGRSAENWNPSGEAEEFEGEHVDYGDSDINDMGGEPDERGSGAQQAESRWRGDEQAISTGEGVDSRPTRRLKSTGGGDYAARETSARDGKGRFGASADAGAEKRMQMSGTAVGRMATGRISEDRLTKPSDTGFSPALTDRKPKEGANRREEKWSQPNRDVPAAGPPYGKRSEGPSRMKSTGWDQLPEGFESPADALRAVKEPGRASRPSLWSGPIGRGSSPAAPPSSRFSGPGRAASARLEPLGERARGDDGPWARDDGTRGRRVEEALEMSPRVASPREMGRGRSRGRGGSPAGGRGRGGGRGGRDPWMDGPNGPWGPARHPSPPPGRFDMGFGGPGPRGPANAAAVAAAKVESSGFVVAPDGTITKPESPGGGGGRGGRGGRGGLGPGMFRGPGMGMGVGPGMGVGMRVGMGLSRGMGMGPGMGMNVGMGMGPGMGMGVGPGVGMGMPGRGAPGGRGGRGMMESFNGPPFGRGIPPFPAASRLDEFPPENNNNNNHHWMRRERSPSPPLNRPRGRFIHSPLRSRSRSRSRSPPPRQGVVGRKRSRSPGLGEARGLGLEPVSPARRSVPPPPKLPLPPPPPRNQRSPPAGLKRLNDKRDAEPRPRERERDRAPRHVRTPPRRTSPHVVHGSSLMDERDRALLAGIRHVSPPAGRHRQDGAAAPGPSIGDAGVGAVGMGMDAGPGAGAMGLDARDGGGKEGEPVGMKAERGREPRVFHDRDRRREEESVSRPASKFSNARPGPVPVAGVGGGPAVGAGVSSFKSSYASSREGDDDVAPRRRRPSP